MRGRGRSSTTTGPLPPVSEYMRPEAVGPSSCIRRPSRRWASCWLLAVGILACGDREHDDAALTLRVDDAMGASEACGTLALERAHRLLR